MDRELLGKILLVASLVDAAIAGALLSSKDESYKLIGQALLPIAPAWLALAIRLLAQK